MYAAAVAIHFVWYNSVKVPLRGDSMVRNSFTFIFTVTLVAVFLIVTGLIGYDPPAHVA